MVDSERFKSRVTFSWIPEVLRDRRWLLCPARISEESIISLPATTYIRFRIIEHIPNLFFVTRIILQIPAK